MIERDLLSKIVQIQVVIKTGSLMDPGGLKGLAHVTGRALLRGTRKRSRVALTTAIERLGGSLGVHIDYERTILRGAVLAQNFGPFLELLREVLTEPAFDPSELEILKATLQGEIQASFQDPQELAVRAALRDLYWGTGAQSPPEGTLGGISAVTPADLRKFFSAHYGAENWMVGICSPFDEQEASDRLTATLGDLRSAISGLGSMPQALLSERKAMIVQRAGMATSPVYMIARGVGDADPRLPELEVGNFIFGEDFTARLMQVLRAENGWTYGASSSYRQLMGPQATPGFFSLYLFPSAEHAALAIPKALSMLEEYADKGMTEDEFEKAREALGHSYAFKTATAEQRLLLKMRFAFTGRKFPNPAGFAQWLSGLSVSQVNASIRATLSTQSLRLVTVGDSIQLKPILEQLPHVVSVQTIEPEELRQ